MISSLLAPLPRLLLPVDLVAVAVVVARSRSCWMFIDGGARQMLVRVSRLLVHIDAQQEHLLRLLHVQHVPIIPADRWGPATMPAVAPERTKSPPPPRTARRTASNRSRRRPPGLISTFVPVIHVAGAVVAPRPQNSIPGPAGTPHGRYTRPDHSHVSHNPLAPSSSFVATALRGPWFVCGGCPFADLRGVRKLL